MSKTDKTNPYWVKLARREWGASEQHEHHGKYFTGTCEVKVPMPPTRGRDYTATCEVWQSYYNNPAGHKIWGRHPKRATRKALGFENGIRMELRQLRRQWRLEPDRDSIDSSWGAPRRRCQVRDPWNWD